MGSAVSRQLEFERPKPKRPHTPPDLRERLKSIPKDNANFVQNVQSANYNHTDNSSTTEVVDLEPPAKLPSELSEKNRVAVCYHSADREISNSIADELRRNKNLVENVLLVNESNSLEYTGASILWSDIVVLVVSYKFQQNPNCQEITNYAKDTQKKVVTIVVQPNYDPSGVVGAVGKAYGQIVWLNKGHTTADILEQISQFPIPPIDTNRPKTPKESSLPNLQQQKIVGNENTIYISHAESTSEKVSNIIKNGRTKNYKESYMAVSGDLKLSSMADFIVTTSVDKNAINEDSIRTCRVFVPVISKDYENSPVCRGEFELARSYRKNIIPIKAEKFSPSGWLAMAMAGKLFYEIKNENDAYDPNPKFPDTNRMTEFINSVKVNIKSVVDESDREIKMKEKLEKEIAEIKPKLKQWPPKTSSEIFETDSPPDSESLLPQKENTLSFAIQQFKVTRLSVNPLYNELGQPIEQTFDCMISYQWEIQGFVETVCEALHIRGVRLWLDMLGGMVGNINDAMARAVEASVCVCVFLSEKYQQSTNCVFELKYAIALNKPLIFVIAEDNLKPLPWIKDLMDKRLVFTMRNVKDFEIPIKGWPTLVVFTDAVRKLAEWKAKQRKLPPSDVSEGVFRLQVLLENAVSALAEQEGQSRWQMCTRCNGKFEDSSKAGCKKHRIYYVGGRITAGRWACCEQTDINSLGCIPADHTVEKRSFVDKDGDGCRSWIPA